MGCCNSEKTEKELLCYCFNISTDAYKQALDLGEDNKLTDFIIWQTKHCYCDCENLNPDKICCLKSFKLYKKQHGLNNENI